MNRFGGKSHLLVDQLRDDASDVSLSTAAHHHLVRVLRLRSGDPVTVTDGRGAWAMTALSALDDAHLELAGPVLHEPPRQPSLCVAFAITKGDKPEVTVQKLTECGIDRIVILEASRSVARWDEARGAKHVERLRTVAAEALMQSRGVWLPRLEGPWSVVRFAQQFAAEGTAIHRADMVGPPLSDQVTTLAIGPEGGWDDVERSALSQGVSFAETVLRAETAAIVGGGLLSAIRHTKSTHSAW